MQSVETGLQGLISPARDHLCVIWGGVHVIGGRSARFVVCASAPAWRHVAMSKVWATT